MTAPSPIPDPVPDPGHDQKAPTVPDGGTPAPDGTADAILAAALQAGGAL